MTEQQPFRAGDPQRVGAYRLVALLGEGGQGAVYRGEAANGEPVAVKLLHARFSGDSKARARFAAELAHAERVAPFCTARVLDADLDGDRPYIVSEFVEGPPLSEVIAAGHLPQGPALERLAIATVTALAAIHEAGVVHRDFKPGNVIMGPDGARVIDFGIARALEATGTLSSAVVGTPAFMAPEQIKGDQVGPAADIFAWGCTIACASNGITPFRQDSIPAVMHRILHEEPDLGRLSGTLRDIVADCLAKEPDRRPTARQILLRLLGGTESATSPETLLAEGSHASEERTSASGQRYTPTEVGWQASAGQATLTVAGAPGTAAAASREDAPGTGSGLPSGPPAPRPHASRKRNRAVPAATAFSAIVLGVVTFLPWAQVRVSDIKHPLVTLDFANVSGIRTVWGMGVLIMAVTAVNIVLTNAFTRRFAAAWAAVPGFLAIASLAGFLLRRQDLHSKAPHTGFLSSDDLRAMGEALHISLSPGVYIALGAAIAVAVLALISRWSAHAR